MENLYLIDGNANNFLKIDSTNSISVPSYPETTIEYNIGFLRYEITVEELRRRVNAPEHLNKVDMISYLRLAKNSARLLLEKYDIISSLHHRLSKHTILSKVSEKECEDLAIGIHDINMSCFPFTVLAEDSISKLKETGVKCDQEKELLKKRYQDLETARYAVKPCIYAFII